MKNGINLSQVWSKVRRYSRRKGATTWSAFCHNAIENVDSLNESTEHWEACRKHDKRFIDTIYADIIALCEIDAKTRVADFGRGTGVLVSKLKSDIPEINIVGYDFSASKIKRCREYYNEPCFFCRSIYDPIDPKYDVTIATEVLEHLEYPMKALQTLLSSITPGGRVFITVPDGRKDTYSGHIHFWSPESWSLFVYEAAGPSAHIKLGKLTDKNYAVITQPQGNVI